MGDRLGKLDKCREVGKIQEKGKWPEVDKDQSVGKIQEMGIPHPMVHMDRVETSHDYNQDDDT